MKTLPDTAYWRVMKPKNETVDEPNNATSKILVHLLFQRKILNTYQQSITLVSISNGRSLQVKKDARCFSTTSF